MKQQTMIRIAVITLALFLAGFAAAGVTGGARLGQELQSRLERSEAGDIPVIVQFKDGSMSQDALSQVRGGKAVWFDNKEKHDQATHQHENDVLNHVGGPAESAYHNIFEQYRQQCHKCGTDEGSENRAKPADNNHEEYEE